MDALIEIGISILKQAPLLAVTVAVAVFMFKKLDKKDKDVSEAREEYVKALSEQHEHQQAESTLQREAIDKLAESCHANSNQQLATVQQITDQYQTTLQDNKDFLNMWQTQLLNLINKAS